MKRLVAHLALGLFAVLLCACGGGMTAGDYLEEDAALLEDVVTTDLPSDGIQVEDTGDSGWEAIEAPVQADCRPNTRPFPERPQPTVAPSLPFLHVDGRDIVDSEGNKVMLRGTNFGSWLMMESWIAGIGVVDQAELLEMMPGKAEELGILEFFTEAQSTNIIDCSFQLKAQWVCVQEWKQYMYANMNPALQDAVDQLWTWFDEQPWIFEERSLWNWFSKRFGYARMLELRRTFQDSYITEKDVRLVSELGMNLIRLPIWYQALETDIEGENSFVEDGWRRLDQVIEWARKYKVYIMLDLHGAPGGQSPWWHQGLENSGQFWTNQACIDKTARLWKALGAYFADEPHVAVLDLLNEPFGAPDHEHYLAAHQAIISAIREVDTAHIVMLEDGFLSRSVLAGPAENGWENAMMSFHDYPGGEDAATHVSMMEKEITDLEKVWSRFDCPLFYGEFNVYGPNSFNAVDDPENRWQVDAMKGVLEMMNRRGVHWAPWSWKYFDSPSLWGVYYPSVGAGERLDVKDTTYATIHEWLGLLDTDNFTLDEAYGEVLMSTAAAPYAPLDLAPAIE